MTDDSAAVDEAVDRAAAKLYAAPVEGFMALRTELSKQVRADGAPAAAKRIAALRKPSVAASVVNRQSLADPACVQRLLEVGSRLRRAHDDLDPSAMRELSLERRSVVAEIAEAALERVGQRDPSTSLRDEITATFDAAVADPEIAGRLGRLTRSEHWSGFGTAPTGSPELTLVRGGKDAPARKPRSAGPDPRSGAQASTEAEAPDKVPAATRRRLARALDKAQSAFHAADERLAEVEASVRNETERVGALTAELSELQKELDEAKRELEQARRDAKSARTRRREARSALDRAERQAAD